MGFPIIPTVCSTLLVALAIIAGPKVLNMDLPSLPNLASLQNITDQSSEPIIETPPELYRNKVCLVTIMKDEMDSFPRLLPSVTPHIGGFVACDTGSTDETVPTLYQYFKDNKMPGTVAHHDWKNFAHNRNLCLQVAQEWSEKQARPCEYWLVVDADMELVTDDGRYLKDMDLTENSYSVKEFYVDTGGDTYTNHMRVLNTKTKWRYTGAVHEFIHRDDGKYEKGPTFDNIRLLHYASFDRGWEKDAKMLEETLEDNPNDDRSHFYLGTTYWNMGRHEDAIKHYIRRVELGGWEEEQFMAAYNIARVAEAMVDRNQSFTDILQPYLRSWVTTLDPDPKKQVINAYIAASMILPYRQEPFIHIAKYYRIKMNDFDRCYRYASMANALGDFKEHSLFPDTWMYKYGALDEMCVCSYYIHKYAEGLKVCTQLETKLRQLNDPKQQSFLDRIVGNKEYHIGKLQSNKHVEF